MRASTWPGDRAREPAQAAQPSDHRSGRRGRRDAEGGGAVGFGQARGGNGLAAGELGAAAIDHDAIAAIGKLERQRAQRGPAIDCIRRRQAGVGNRRERSRGKPDIARMAGVGDRASGHGIGQEYGAAGIGKRVARALEHRNAAIAMGEEAQHRQHSLDRCVELCRQRYPRVLAGLAERQEVKKHAGEFGGTARDMSAIGIERALEQVRQRNEVLATQMFEAAQAYRGMAQREQHRKSRGAAGG